MRICTADWRALAQSRSFIFDTKARIGSKDYETISAPVIDRSLITEPLSVGNCISATLHLSILTNDRIAKAAPITILGRLRNGEQTSEWKEFGTFFVDQRDTDYDGLVTVDCYDAMLKANQQYLGAQDSHAWPKSMKAVVEEIAYRIGVGIDERTRIRPGRDYMVPKPEGLTMLQVLGYIGACHGGNWTITEDNLLRLIPLTSAPPESYYVIDSDGSIITAAEGDRLIYRQPPSEETPTDPVGLPPTSVIPRHYRIVDQHRNRIATHTEGYLIWDRESSHSFPAGAVDIPVVCGQLTKGDALIISRVTMEAGEASYTAGNDSGATLLIEGNPYATQGICDNIYSALSGLIYRPFAATKALYDPAAELGDPVRIGDVVGSVLFGARLTLDHNFRADIQAPNSDELSAEYPYLPETKSLRQTTEELSAAVSRAASDLQSKVSSTELQAEIDRASAAELALNTAIGAEESRAKNAERTLDGRITALGAADIGATAQIGGVQQTTVAAVLSALASQHDVDLAAIELALTAIRARLDALENQ